MISRAASFAARAHAYQRRDDLGDAYFTHLAEVAEAVAACEPFDVFLVSAAFLHDTVEDTEVTMDDIVRLFGPETAAIVAEVTDAPETPQDAKHVLQAEQMKTASRSARLIKLADKTSNVRELVVARTRFGKTGPKKKHMRLYLENARLVVDVCRGTDPRLERAFDQAATELESLSTKSH